MHHVAFVCFFGFLIGSGLVAACGTAPARVPLDRASAEPADASAPGVRVDVLEFAATQVPPEITVRGDIVGGLSFTDARGHNLAVFTALERQHEATGPTAFGFSEEVTSVYLHALHYRRDDTGGYRLVRDVVQADENCDGDTATRFHADSFGVTDLDADGVGEIGFGYFSEGCRTDVSPSVFKLFLLEDGAKLVVRGPSHWRSAEEPPGEPTSSDGLDQAPPAFADYLDERWATLSSED